VRERPEQGLPVSRFRETSIVDRRVRGDVPSHPLPSGERLFLIFPRRAWLCFPVVLIVLVLIDFWALPLFGVSPERPGAARP